MDQRETLGCPLVGEKRGLTVDRHFEPLGRAVVADFPNVLFERRAQAIVTGASGPPPA